jgi:flavocytochrome c
MKESNFQPFAYVIVVGSGFAGLAAAIEAHEAGASVVVLEKMAGIGGNSVISDGVVAAAGTPFQKNQGIEDSPERMAADMLTAGQGLGHRDLVLTVAQHSAQSLEWLIDDLGVVFIDCVDQFGGHSAPRSHTPSSGRSGVYIYKRMLTRVRQLKIPIYLRCKVTDLTRDCCGPVNGVRALRGYRYKRYSGDAITIGARGAVILAAGGFAADLDFRSAHDPRLGAAVDTTNKPYATADVIKSAIRIGALPVHLSWIQLGPWTSPDEKRFGAGPDFSGYAGFPYGIMVDPVTGRRFVNELSDRKTRCDALLSLKHPAVVIADAAAVRVSAIDLRRSMQKGVVRSFDSIGQLAQFYAISPSALEGTVRCFNAAFEHPAGDELGKPLLGAASPICHPPYYAMRVWPKTHYTMGGILIDTRARVLDLCGQPINGLYSAGEIAGFGLRPGRGQRHPGGDPPKPPGASGLSGRGGERMLAVEQIDTV